MTHPTARLICVCVCEAYNALVSEWFSWTQTIWVHFFQDLQLQKIMWLNFKTLRERRVTFWYLKFIHLLTIYHPISWPISIIDNWIFYIGRSLKSLKKYFFLWKFGRRKNFSPIFDRWTNSRQPWKIPKRNGNTAHNKMCHVYPRVFSSIDVWCILYYKQSTQKKPCISA